MCMCMCVCMGICVGMSMSMGVGMRMGVSEGKSCVIRYGTWRVNPVIALKLKSLLYSLSMCSYCMRKADSSQPCTPDPSRYRAACHPSVATNPRTPFKAATIQKTQDGCSCSCIGGQVMRVAESMILKLRQEE